VAVQTARWIYRPGPFMEECRRNHGEIFTVRLAQAGPIMFIADPDAVKEVFRGDPGVFQAGAANQQFEAVFGPRSILLLDGKEHLRQRRLMLPPFHGERLPRYAAVMREVVEEEMQTWPLGEPFSLHPHLQEMTLQVIMRAVFGFEEPHRRARLRDALLRFIDASLNPWAAIPWFQHDFADWSPWGRFMRAVDGVDAIIYEEIEERRREPDLESRDDIFSMLISARDEDGEPMTPAELRDEMLTLLLAGHETTATALAWGFMHLLRRPDSLERAVSEAREGDGMEYAEAIANETLRLRPPIPVVGRHLAAPATVAGFDLPAGMMVAPCIYLMHRREDLYPNPYAFEPERFLGTKPETYTWLPFGGGVRRCLGATFAIFEMKVLIHEILARAVLKPVGERELMRRRAIVFAPERGAQAVMTERLAPRERVALAAA
jgi:cytochrome P450